MLKYQPSRRFLIAMGTLGPLMVAICFGLVPELEAMRKPRIPGEFSFPERKSDDGKAADVSGGGFGGWGEAPLDWFQGHCENLMSWDKNPWKMKASGFGDHYFGLLGSRNPMDRARAAELRRLAEALHRLMVERFPELAVPMRDVPPERNGFLKWLELSERLNPNPGNPMSLLPREIQRQLDQQASWDETAIRAWLATQQPLLDEIRAIGLMPGRSVADIEVNRYGFISARFAKGCADMLLLDARLAAEDGDVARALSSMGAAVGIADHLGNVETPSLLATTVRILIRLGAQGYAISEVMPRLPAGQLVPEAWERALKPVVHSPAEFARLMKGEWNITARQYLLPMVMDAGDPKYPPDPEALLDWHAEGFVETVRNHEGKSLPELPGIAVMNAPASNRHLSRQSRRLTENLFVGAGAWRKGWDRSQSASAMTLAAFAIMKGQALPADPVYGLPYRWDPATRTLSAPDSPAFEEMRLKPVKVPKP